MKLTEFFVRRPILFWSLMAGILISTRSNVVKRLPQWLH